MSVTPPRFLRMSVTPPSFLQISITLPSFLKMSVTRPDFSDFFDRASRARSPHFDRARLENHEPGMNVLPNFQITSANIGSNIY